MDSQIPGLRRTSSPLMSADYYKPFLVISNRYILSSYLDESHTISSNDTQHNTLFCCTQMSLKINFINLHNATEANVYALLRVIIIFGTYTG